MSINTSDIFVQKLEKSLGTASELLEPEELSFAASQALAELGWGYPVPDGKKEFWAIQRGKRHSLDLLRIASAHKFKYKQINLDDRFEHYNALINKMDEDFEKAVNSDPDLMDIDLTKFFGVYVDDGFVYDQFGNDITKILDYYNIDNEGFRYRTI